jgi:hypothetical protein
MNTDGGNASLIFKQNRDGTTKPIWITPIVGHVQDLCYFQQQGVYNEQFKAVRKTATINTSTVRFAMLKGLYLNSSISDKMG